MSPEASGPLGFPPDPAAPPPVSADPAGPPPVSADPAAQVPVATPSHGSGCPPSSPAGARYGWIAGVVGVVLLSLIALNTLRTHGPGSRGILPGRALPPFAVPLALGSLRGDADVATRPGQGAVHAACSLRGPGILNVCEQYERAPLVLAFLTTRGAGRCQDELDVLQRLQGRFARVRFAAVAIGGDRGGLRSLVRRRGWSFPVGYDRDGAVANLYAAAICPQIVLAARGGISRGTLLGYQRENQLVTAIRPLAAAR